MDQVAWVGAVSAGGPDELQPREADEATLNYAWFAHRLSLVCP
jgi:hypothetical protein